MRQTIIWSAAVLCAALILATGTTEAPPQPKVTEVTGTVDVGNFPPTQNVAGTVDMGNLPVDVDGNVRIAAMPERQIHFKGYTADRFPTNTFGIQPLSLACNAEFAGGRICEQREFLFSIPPPPVMPNGCTHVAVELNPVGTPGSNLIGHHIADVVNDNSGFFVCPPTGPWPVACCGF